MKLVYSIDSDDDMPDCIADDKAAKQSDKPMLVKMRGCEKEQRNQKSSDFLRQK